MRSPTQQLKSSPRCPQLGKAHAQPQRYSQSKQIKMRIKQGRILNILTAGINQLESWTIDDAMSIFGKESKNTHTQKHKISYSNSCPLSRWCRPTVSSSVVPFSSCLQSFPASVCFPMIWLFTSGGQSIGASASVFLLNIQDWFPFGWPAWMSLQSKGLSRVFSSTKVQKHQFFNTPLSLWSNSHIHTWLLEKPYLWYRHDKVILYHGYSLKGSI